MIYDDSIIHDSIKSHFPTEVDMLSRIANSLAGQSFGEIKIDVYIKPTAKRTNFGAKLFGHPGEISVEHIQFPKDAEEYESDKRWYELKEKFTSELMKISHFDPTTKSVLSSLVMQDDPYKMVEQLLKDRIHLVAKMQEYIMKNP